MTKRNVAYLSFLAIPFLFNVSAYLNETSGVERTIQARSASLIDVRKAISNAGPGDTVMVPAGTASWDGQLVITKGIKLVGAGMERTIITGEYAAPTLNDSTGYLIAYLPDSPKSNQPFRVSGFGFDLSGTCQWIYLRNRTLHIMNRVRIDHNKVKNSAKRMITVRGTIYGVIDNNVLFGGLMLTAYGLNAASWNNLTFRFGSADNLYFEDNICTVYTTPHDGGIGGRYCVRYNRYTYINQKQHLVPWFDMHGNQGVGQNWAGMGAEIYENVLEAGGRIAKIADIRGGKALVYDNRVNTTSRSRSWVAVREEYNDALNPPAVDPKSRQPQHVSETYIWGNSQNGEVIYKTSIAATVDYGGKIGIVPQRNVDFWQQEPHFDGTSGMGAGTLAERPGKGVPGVGYWATDVKKLFRWSATNQWEEFYIPFPYPHPLREQK